MDDYRAYLSWAGNCPCPTRRTAQSAELLDNPGVKRDQLVAALDGGLLFAMNIRLITPRPHETAQLRREAHDYAYDVLGGLIISALIVAAPLVRLWASVNW